MQTPVLILFLSLTFLMATPSPVITSVRAVAQSGNTTWSPYGPYSRNLLISFYSDFQAMFNAFTSGKIDITDWPVQPGDLQAFSGNPDYFLTSPEGQFGLFHLNINQNGNFLGIVQQQSRSTVAASVKNTASAANTCLTGFARLIVNLHTQELPGKPLIPQEDGHRQHFWCDGRRCFRRRPGGIGPQQPDSQPDCFHYLRI